MQKSILYKGGSGLFWGAPKYYLVNLREKLLFYQNGGDFFFALECEINKQSFLLHIHLKISYFSSSLIWYSHKHDFTWLCQNLSILMLVTLG